MNEPTEAAKSVATAPTAVIAETPYGTLRGIRTTTGLAFLGLRYGEPPIGPRRFAPPSRYRSPSGSVDATRFGPSPPQFPAPATPRRPAFAPRQMSEDCLNLNVWTPAVDDGRRPVLAHVFGGGFETGSASDGLQNGAALSARADAVVVRINFRIGALGFLTFGETFGSDFVGGNVGLLDLCLALEWTKENIRGLGGDPENITVFGLSSGAFMIAALLALPQTRGLFARAWLQSGSASRVLTRAQALATTQEFVREVEVEPGDRAALARLDVAKILQAQRRIAAVDLGDRNAPGGRTLGIVEDGVTLARHPMQAIAGGERRDTPVLLGFARDEARMWFADGLMRLPGSMDDVLAEMVRFTNPSAGIRLFAYYRDEFPNLDPSRLREKFLSDAIYAIPAIRTARTHKRAGGKAYLYRFDWAPQGAGAAFGAAHGFDEAFVWNVVSSPLFPLAAGDPAATVLAESMSNSLIAFARTGDPGWPSASDELAIRVFGTESDKSTPIPAQLLRAWKGVERR